MRYFVEIQLPYAPAMTWMRDRFGHATFASADESLQAWLYNWNTSVGSGISPAFRIVAEPAKEEA